MTGDPFFANERPGYLLISNRVVPALLQARRDPGADRSDDGREPEAVFQRVLTGNLSCWGG
jgi:hypothetical protein